MRRATTPTHTFTFPFDTESYEKIIITYMQRGNVVMEKQKEDLTLSGCKATYTMTQEETFDFEPEEKVMVQVRVKTVNGDVMASSVMSFVVHPVFNEEVL